MFALIAVGAAGVVDGFAAGLYIGHRWTKYRLKAAAELEAAKQDIDVGIEHVVHALNPQPLPPGAPAADAASKDARPVMASDLAALIEQRVSEGKPR